MDMSNGFENEGVITAEEIRQILEKYRIGKKPLAKLLGWGETTIIRYMEGDIPTVEYSNKLRTILDNPEYYYDLLMKRKDCLTNVAFKKSRKAVLSKIMASRIYAVAYYIINKSDAEICASYIQYLLYYIQAFSLALYDKEMFEEDYIINNEYIPYMKLYQNMKRCGIQKLALGEEYLNEKEKELIDEILETFSWYGPKAMQTLMNFERTMLKAASDRYSYKIISKNIIRQYFKNVCEKYDIKSVKDIKNYPQRCLNHIFEQKVCEYK